MTDLKTEIENARDMHERLGIDFDEDHFIGGKAVDVRSIEKPHWTELHKNAARMVRRQIASADGIIVDVREGLIDGNVVFAARAKDGKIAAAGHAEPTGHETPYASIEEMMA